MGIQFWAVLISAVAIVLAFYVLTIGFLKVPNVMYKWNTVSLMVNCLATNVFFISCIIAEYDVRPSHPRLVFYATNSVTFLR